MQKKMNNQNNIAKNSMNKYNKIEKQISYLTEDEKKEGMINLVDIQAMEQDSSLWVNMENGQFVIWALIALGLISATIIISSRRKK